MTATILVVEDNESLRKLMRVTLEIEGYRVLEAGDGEAALRALDEGNPQLVIQDLVLPGLDGFELVRRLRRSKKGADIPILACSGFISKLEEARVSALGFDDFLLKPIEPDRLLEAVRQRLPAQLPAPLARRPPGGRALLVDDDRVRRKLAAIHLELMGFEVVQAADGFEALALARQSPPRIIVSDIIMPRVDGFALCLEARKDPRLQGIPIVLFTANLAEDGDFAQAKRVGANRLVVLAGELEPLTAAVRASLTEPVPVALTSAIAQVDEQRTYRVVRNMQRQLAVCAGLNQRCAVQAAELSVLEGIAQALTSSANMEVALKDILSRCLEAGGISAGVLYRRDSAGFAIEAKVPEEGPSQPPSTAFEDLLGHPELFDGVLERGVAIASPSAGVPDEVATAVFERTGLLSFVVAPVIGGQGPSSRVLFFGATRRNLSGEDSISFARSVASQVSLALSLKDLYERAGEAVHARDEFLSVAAHELRTPLTTLSLRTASLLASAVAAKGSLEPAAYQTLVGGLEVSSRQIGRLARLIDELLDVVRIAGAQLHLEYEEVDAAELVRDLGTRYAEELRKRGCELRLSMEPSLVGEWDRLRVEQIVVNLLSNAMKYGEGKPIEIELGGTAEILALKVRDHGIGISEADQARIFERFERAASNRHYGGFGLGLWIVKQVLDALGGEIQVTSEPGIGSTFTVLLPRHRPKASAVDAVAP